MMNVKKILSILIIIIGITMLWKSPTRASEEDPFVLTSDAFEEGEEIPTLYTCDGKNISPPLEWSKVPRNTKSFAIICEDPDAPSGTWVHWVVFNISKELTTLVPDANISEQGGVVGTNSWDQTKYGGPCPPFGKHRYSFKLYALDTILYNQDSSTTKQTLLSAMSGHIINQAVLMGTYEKK